MAQMGKRGGGLPGDQILQFAKKFKFWDVEPSNPRVEPYNIPEVPSSSSNLSASEVEAIKHRRAREQNKLASQKSRFFNILVQIVKL